MQGRNVKSEPDAKESDVNCSVFQEIGKCCVGLDGDVGLVNSVRPRRF